MPIRLDERLTRVASLVTGGSAADIGCDHGKLAYYLVGTDRAEKVIATDISEGSLQKATELAAENGVERRMPTRLGDGLDPIASGEVDTVIIAGLGGDVIADIIKRAYVKGKRFANYVLSPNTHPEKVRRALVEIGQKIVYDSPVICAGKRYTVIKSEEGQSSLDALREQFGAFYDSDPMFASLAEEELRYVELLLQTASSEKLKQRAEMLKTALNNAKMRDKL